jgi:hypothetical protein
MLEARGRQDRTWWVVALASLVASGAWAVTPPPPKAPRKPAGLDVTSAPAGAAVFVEGRRRCATPCLVPLGAGTWTVTLRLAGYEPASETVELGRGARLERTWRLVPLAIPVAIESLPPGAEVFVDGVARGRAPLTVALPAGPHRLYATRDGFAPDDATYTLAPGEPTTWRAFLTPLEPPLPPPLVAVVPVPVPVPEGTLDAGARASVEPRDAGAPATAPVDLASPEVPLAEKRRSLAGLQGQELGEALRTVNPPADRAALCEELRARVPAALLQVRSLDADGAPVEAEVVLDGRPLGRSPLDELVPTCAQGVEVVVGPDRRRTPLALSPREKKLVQVDWEGTPTLWSVSAYGDATLFPAPVPPQTSLAASPTFGGGVRLDKWGSVFHGTFALGVSPLLGPLLKVPVLPSFDLFAGVNFHPGSRMARVLISAQLGLWNCLQPAARATLGLMLAERFLLTASADARLMLLSLIVPSPFAQLLPGVVVLGLSVAIGVAW